MSEAVKNRELVSALVDGELRGAELAQALEWAGHDDEGQSTWCAYQILGEVLRSGESMATGRDAAFLARLKGRLQDEQSLTSNDFKATELIALEASQIRAGAKIDVKTVASNDAVYRWKRLAGFASLLAATVIGGVASGVWDGQRGAAVIAQGEAKAVKPDAALTALGRDEAIIMIRDPQLDAFMAAHKQFGGTSALQGPNGFLRNATFEGGAR